MIIEFIQNHQNWVIGNRIALSEEEGNPYINLKVAKVINESIIVSGGSGGAQSTVSLVDSAGNPILPAGIPSKIVVELTRPADATPYTANDAINSSVGSPVALTFSDVSVVVGGGGVATVLKVESNITAMAGATLRFWFFRDTPGTIPGDNTAHVNLYANSSARCFFADVTFEPLLAGSDSVYGQAILWNEYVTNASKNIYALVQTLSAFTPTSGGKIKASLSVLKLS